MGILSWILVGLIAGWLAGLVMKGSGYGLVGNLVVGVIGALVGGWLAGVLFKVDGISGFNITTILVALVGAIVFIFILRLFSGKGR